MEVNPLDFKSYSDFMLRYYEILALYGHAFYQTEKLDEAIEKWRRKSNG